MEFVFTMFECFTFSKPYQHNGFNAIKKCNSIHSCLSANYTVLILYSSKNRLYCTCMCECLCVWCVCVHVRVPERDFSFNLYRSGHALVLSRRYKKQVNVVVTSHAVAVGPPFPSGTGTPLYYCFVFRCRSIHTHEIHTFSSLSS